MGTWGPTLYANDISSDVRDMCNEVYPLIGIEAGTALIQKEYADIINGEVDNDYVNFWLALADWQWKHGILIDEIKETAIRLLETHAGIEEWETVGRASDVKKRLAVLDALLVQLRSCQPLVKIPQAKMEKPKHKPGDIIIVRTCTKNHEYAASVWNVEACRPFVYVPEIACKLPNELCPPYEAYDRYIAILCVGAKKIPHSQYVDGFFDEYSIYAFYDYVGEEKPTIETLKKCGFLSRCATYAKNVRRGVDWVGREYTFLLYSYAFRLGKKGIEQSIEKTVCASESERFYTLLKQKGYSGETFFSFELYHVFSSFFEEKAQLSVAGIPYDNLLDADKTNPPLCSPEEISRLWEEEE